MKSRSIRKVIVTGGAGFIGSAVIRQLIKETDIPDELVRREDRLAAIKKAKAEIERRIRERFEVEQAEYEEKLKKREERKEAAARKVRGRAPKPPHTGPREKDQVNFTDEESRIVPSAEGFVQAYSTQTAVDVDTHLIVESHLSKQANDKQKIGPTLKQFKDMEDRLGKPDAVISWHVMSECNE